MHKTDLSIPLCLLALIGFCIPSLARGQTYGGKIGIDLDGVGGLIFVDAGKEIRSFEGINKGDTVPKDDFGWPKSDARTVIFDYRPIPAWAPPVDDPDKLQIDVSGTYKMSLTGQAVIGCAEEPEDWSIENQKYDAATNTTTADVIMKKGKGLMFMTFTRTKRSADSPENTGISDLKLIRPGYPADTKQTFTNEYLKAMAPFAVLRMMDFTGTNFNETIRWSDRKRPTDATQMNDMNRQGIAWEYVAELANTSGKDIWINLPAEADDDYVRELAKLLKAGLKPNLKIYVEHSSEVWNHVFLQAKTNREAAVAEVNRGNSNLNTDGRSDPDTIAARRHARRLIEIGNIFADVFGKAELNKRIRPVLAWCVTQPEDYAQALEWTRKTYGDPKSHFWAIASAGYFTIAKNQYGDVGQLLVTLRASCDDNNESWRRLDGLAKQYGLKHVIYEGGPDVGHGHPDNVVNRIRVSHDPRIADIVKYQIRTNWFSGPEDRDLFIYFSLCSSYCRWGCWGATEDMTNLGTPKYKALLELTGYKGDHPQ